MRIPSRTQYQVRDPTFEEKLLEGNNIGYANINKIILSFMKMNRKYHQAAALYRMKGLNGSYRAIKSQSEWIQTSLEQFNNKNKQKHINNMCKLSKVTGIITNFQNDMYSVAVDNTNVHIPYGVMHKFPAFANSMMVDNHLKVGTNIIMAKKDDKTYYPDHETYGVRNNQEVKTPVDGSYLLQFAKPFKQVSNLNEMVGKLNRILLTLPEDTRQEVLMLLSSSDLNEEQKAEKLTTLVNLPLDFTESQTLEKKTSLFHYAGRSYDDKAQVKEIVESIVAMCNCKNQQPSQIIIGVNDKTNQTNKLQDEIATFYPQMETLDKFQSTFLVPFIKSYTYDNPMLMSSLKYNWHSYNGDLILIIDIDYHGDPIICKGGRLPYRCGTSKMVVEGMDLVNMVKKLSHNQ